jgi:serine phosphatase RsbU (regulator of sigma subunit)
VTRPGDIGDLDPASATAIGVAAAPTQVLLVEDDPGDALLVKEMLADAAMPFELTWARSLREAEERSTIDFSCVLLDLGLPDAQGLSGLERVLELARRSAVVVLTGFADEHRGIQAVAAGAQDYLVKSEVDSRLLSRSIRYAVERRRADESLRRLYQAEVLAAENARLERGLLPSPLVSDTRIRIATRYRPGRAQALLGGDFYDVVQTPDGALHAIIGDISGHGPDEAALGVCLRIAWRSIVLAGIAPDRVLAAVEALMVSERASPEIFATACMLTIDPDRRSAAVRMAGHPPPLLLTSAPRSVPESPAGPALGILPGNPTPAVHLPLGPRWRLMLYTDGLIEGRIGVGSARLGVPGLIDLVRRGGEIGAGLLDMLLEAAEDMNGGPLADDVAIMLLTHEPGEQAVRGQPPTGAARVPSSRTARAGGG